MISSFLTSDQFLSKQEGAESNPFTSSIAIHACASMADLTLGTQLHCSSLKSGHVHSLPVSNAIIDLYFKCNCISEAKQYFREMHQRDLITWNTMIARLDQCGSHEAITLLPEMSLHSVEPNCFTFTSIVSACARLALLNCGQQVHASIIRRGFSQNLQVSNALVNMYTKCGSIIDSIKIFDGMSHKDIVSYTSMMVGYGFNGYAEEAIDLFEEMTSFGIQPDSVVFIGLLSACSHAGLVDEGLSYFNRMTTEYNVKPDKEVYGCVVDLLGRAGRVEEAYELIESMPFEADESIWGALLGACRVHGNVEMGRLAGQRVLELRPEGAEGYVMVANVLAAEGEFGQVREMRRRMRRGGGRRKEAGRSWVEVRGDVCGFVAGDRSGSLCVSLACEVLEVLYVHMDGTLDLFDMEIEGVILL